jgi:5-methylcytosine-specific restriction endonuclease McrBC GTP-binding regulatory subunit McrB
MVLDEMNISRIEYYFADFLSILEYPPAEWKIKVYEPELNQVLPKKLEGGYVTIPDTTWFIGTANTDDSTFTITDKVYDRAVILDFNERFSPIKSDYNSDPIELSADELVAMFKEAQNDPSKGLSEEDTAKFLKVCDFVSEAFDIRFGNRVMVQINNFVPVYVAMGGTREEALDFMFTTKVLRKLRGVYEDYVKDELLKLTKLLNSLYGKGTFKMAEKFIAKLNKKLV